VTTAPAETIYPADLLPVQRKATFTYRLVRILLLPVFHALFAFMVKGQQNTPKNQPYIIIANHLAWLDAFMITASFPPEPRIHFLGIPGGLSQRRLSWWVVRKIGGFIPVNPGANTRSLYFQVDRCLQAGGVVALFPEGHGGDVEGNLDPFKKGFAVFAINNHVPVLPVALSGVKELWLRKKVWAFIGEPIDPEGYSVEALVDEGHRRVRELLPEYHEPRGPKVLRKWLSNLF
jgi:1-acyl-sn-glycerol-3-phosphate acyltransferase